MEYLIAVAFLALAFLFAVPIYYADKKLVEYDKMEKRREEDERDYLDTQKKVVDYLKRRG